jgi:hypothetical protein
MADDNLQGSHHMLINRNLGALAVATFLTSACTAASDGQTGRALEETPSYSVSLTTDSSAYDSGKPIVVTYDGLPGDPTDWISLTPSEESDYNFVAWQYTDGSASGQVSFTANLPPGTYVARAYPLDGYERAGQSAAFTVGLEGVSVSTNQLRYRESDSIVVSFVGLTVEPTNWITVVPANSGPKEYGEFHYTNGDTSGQMTFAPLAAGEYEVRAFYNDRFTLVGHAAFTVVGPPALAPEATSYQIGDNVTVEYQNLPGNALDWLALVPKGGSDFNYVAWMYTGGTTDGAATFTNLNLRPGTYVARAFANDGYERVAESGDIKVGLDGVSLALERSTYSPNDAINLSYAGLPADATNWITIVPAGSALNRIDEWHYTAADSNGQLAFAALPAGTYEARAFLANDFTLATTITLVVTNNNASVTSSKAQFGIGESITIEFTGAPGSAKDWIAISPAGSDATTYGEWAYLDGATSGSHVFGGLAPGSYEARIYANDGFTIVGSALFSVGGATVAASVTDTTATVDFAGLPGNAADWVAIYESGAPDDQYVAWRFAGGHQAGSLEFADLPVGTYEARSFINGDYTLAARSTTFTVGSP